MPPPDASPEPPPSATQPEADLGGSVAPPTGRPLPPDQTGTPRATGEANPPRTTRKTGTPAPKRKVRTPKPTSDAKALPAGDHGQVSPPPPNHKPPTPQPPDATPPPAADSEVDTPKADNKAATPANDHDANTPGDGGDVGTPKNDRESDTPEAAGEVSTASTGHDAGAPRDGVETPGANRGSGTPEVDHEAGTSANGREVHPPADNHDADTPEDGGEVGTAGASRESGARGDDGEVGTGGAGRESGARGVGGEVSTPSAGREAGMPGAGEVGTGGAGREGGVAEVGGEVGTSRADHEPEGDGDGLVGDAAGAGLENGARAVRGGVEGGGGVGDDFGVPWSGAFERPDDPSLTRPWPEAFERPAVAEFDPLDPETLGTPWPDAFRRPGGDARANGRAADPWQRAEPEYDELDPGTMRLRALGWGVSQRPRPAPADREQAGADAGMAEAAPGDTGLADLVPYDGLRELGEQPDTESATGTALVVAGGVRLRPYGSGSTGAEVAVVTPPPGPQTGTRGPGRRGVALAAAFAVVAAAILVAPRLIGTGTRPQLLDQAVDAAVSAATSGVHLTAPPTGLPGVPTGSTSPGQVAHFEEEVIAQVNAARISAGCAPVIFDPRLEAAAVQHSEDMAKMNLLTHLGSDGSSVADRIAEQGYFGTVSAENIGRGYQDPDALMSAWNKSATHFANIVNCDLRVVGVGYVPAGSWWTATFGG